MFLCAKEIAIIVSSHFREQTIMIIGDSYNKSGCSEFESYISDCGRF